MKLYDLEASAQHGIADGGNDDVEERTKKKFEGFKF